MTMDRDPWKKQWHPFVEGREDLGGAEAHFIDIEKDVLNAPRARDVMNRDIEYELNKSTADNGLESAAATVRSASSGVLSNMQSLGIIEAGTVLAKLEETPIAADDIFNSAAQAVATFYTDQAESAPTLEAEEEFKKLADITRLAVHLANARLLLFFEGPGTEVREILDSAEDKLHISALTPDAQTTIRSMIEDMR
jgi:hypothetical protein